MQLISDVGTCYVLDSASGDITIFSSYKSRINVYVSTVYVAYYVSTIYYRCYKINNRSFIWASIYSLAHQSLSVLVHFPSAIMNGWNRTADL